MAVEFEKLVVLMEASVAKFDKDIQNIAKTVDTQMRQIETSTARATGTVEKNVEALASKLTGMRGLFGPLSAAAIAFGAIRFGENIIENIDEITRKARQMGIEIDQGAVNSIRNFKTQWERYWLEIQAAMIPTLAELDKIIKLAQDAGKFLQFGSAAGQAAVAGVLGAPPAAAPAAPKMLGGPFATDEQFLAQQRKNAQDAIDAAKKAADESRRAAEKAASEREQALRALDATDECLSNEKSKRDHEAAQEQIRLLEDVARANAKAEADITRQHDKALTDRLDKSIEEFREYERIEEDRAREAAYFNRQIAADIADFGDIMEQAGGKFGKAVELMILDLAKLALRITATKALESSLGNIGGSSGFLGSLLGLVGLRAAGGPVASGSPYIVGEQGPELFVPRVPGMIVPNGAAPASGAMNLQVVVNGARGNQEITAMVAAGVSQGIAAYDRNALPGRVWTINNDPLAR